MNLFRKIILLIIFLLVLYILYRLIQKRIEILKVIQNVHREGLTPLPSIKLDSVNKIVVANNVPVKLQSAMSNPSIANLPLYKCFIKSSMNSAYDGANISTDMVLYILSRGYRFLDFEVYYETPNVIVGADGKKPTAAPSIDAVVGFSNTGSSPSVSNTRVLLSDILNVITMNAFTNPSPNNDDPLFIQIRPMYVSMNPNDDEKTNSAKKSKNTALNTQIEKALGALSAVQYSGQVTAGTKMNKLNGKIIVVMDSKSNAMNTKSEKLTNNLINMSFFTNDFKMYDYGKKSGIKTTDSNILTEILLYDSNHYGLSYNPNSIELIDNKVPCNILPFMAWMSSYLGGSSLMGMSSLGIYESLFNSAGGSAFIELSEAQSYAFSNTDTKLNSKVLTV